MADYVVTATLVDGMSDPATKAAAAMDKAAASADNLSGSVTKVGPSAQALAARFDTTTQATNAYKKAVDALADAQATLTIGVAEGKITQDAANGVLLTLQNRVAATRTAMAAATPATTAMAGATVVAAEAAGEASIAHAGFTRELVILGHEVVVGNYSRIPGSMMVLAERTGNLNGILSTLGSIVFGWPGLFAAGAAALAYAGYSAEMQAEQFNKLQASLMATRDDYSAMAAEAEAAGKATAGYGGFGKTDTVTAAGTIAAQPGWQGDQAQLEALIKTSADLATVWDETLPQAAKTLAQAMTNPGAEADTLAKDHFPGMTQALADQVKAMQASGDAAGAFGLVLDDLQDHVSGAATKSKTTLQTALENLSAQFRTTGSDGETMGESVGGAMDAAAAHAVDAVATIIGAIDRLRGYSPGAAVNSAGTPVLATAPVGENGYPGATANVLTSPAGAIGIMQLMPATAAGLGVDPTNPLDNIAGGMKLIAQLSQQYGANVDQILAAYNTGSPDTATPAAQAYIAQVHAANPAALQNRMVMNGGQPESVAFAIQDAGNNVGLSQELINLGQQIAMVESSGRQYSTASYSPGSAKIYPNEAAVGPFMAQAPANAAGAPGIGVVNTPDRVVSQALAAADKASTPEGAGSAAFAQIQLYKGALADLAAQGDTTSDSVTKLEQALQKAQVTFTNAIAPADAMLRTLQNQAAGNGAVAAAWANGAAAADHAANEVKAQQQALQYAAPGTQQYTEIVQALGAAYDAVAASQQKVTAAKDINQQGQDLDYLQAEAATLGQSAEARATALAVMKEQQTIENTMPLIEASEKQKILDNTAAQAEMTYQLQQQQQALSDLASSFSSAFDTIGNAMAQAFVQGQGAAVNWRNVTASAVEQVVQEFLKLAVLNPILNSAFGQSNTTLGSVVSAISGGSVSGSSTAGHAGSTGDSSGLLSDLSSVSKLFTSGSGSISSTVDNLGAQYLPSVFSGSTTDSAISELGAGVYGPAAPAGLANGGSALAGFGAASNILGIGGAILPGLISGNYAQAAAGGIGAAIGTAILPGIGTILGGLAGNLLGGSIGPGPKNPFSFTAVSNANGDLTQGATQSQLVSGGAAAVSQQEASINAALANLDLVVTQFSGQIKIGTDPHAKSADPNLFSDFETANSTGATAFSKLEFASTNDPTLSKYLSGQSFANLSDLESVISGYETFVNTTVPGLEAFNTVTGSLNTTLAGITAQFGPAITTAQNYGVATAALTAAQAAAVQQAQDAAGYAFEQGNLTNNANYLSAKATITGNPSDALNAQLAAFDISAAQQEKQLSDSLVATYGTAYKTSYWYGQDMAQLETSLGEQRLAIQQQFNDKLTQTADQAVTSLGSFAQSLEFGSGSPLSATDQYSLAQTDFQADVTGAKAGDFTSLSDLQSAASTLLSTSSAVNGSGAQYVADFNSVLDALQAVAAIPPDTLTAGVLQSEVRTQTQQLQDSLSDLGTKLDAIRTALKQASAAPARIT